MYHQDASRCCIIQAPRLFGRGISGKALLLRPGELKLALEALTLYVIVAAGRHGL